MKSRLFLFIAVAAALLLSTGADCVRHHLDGIPHDPMAPFGPESTWAGAPTVYGVVTTISRDAIRYVMDWGDTTDTTIAEYASGETAAVSHVWTASGDLSIKVMAFNAAFPEKVSNWSMVKSVRVVPDQAPVIDSIVRAPRLAVIGAPYWFTVRAHDPDGDSIRAVIDWGDGKDTTTGYFPSPCSVTVGHVFTKVETAMVLVRAQDQKGATSQPDTVLVPVGTAGGVIWYWWVEELYITATSSPVVVMDEGKEVLVAVFDDGQIHELDPATGRALRVITLPCWALGWVAFCGQTHHLIAGDQIGDLCAVALDGTIPWQWPAQAPFWDFGAPAIRDDRIYICCDDSIRCLRDEDSICAPIGAYAPQGRVADAPVIDAQGNVYFGTDSGYLYKMGPELDTVFWRTRLLAKGEVHGPVIGGDGTIYCASDSFRLYAIDPATGIPSWTVTLDGDVFRPAIGQSAVFVGSSLGKVYSISPTGGSINWEKSLSQISGFSTTPIIAANGYVYFQDDADVLYCVNQADGTLIWSCNCPRYLPRTGGGSSHRPGRLQLTDYPPNPSICANGNIIVVGADACYCVAGYPEGPLDLSAPWPKWQKNLWNTGK